MIKTMATIILAALFLLVFGQRHVRSDEVEVSVPRTKLTPRQGAQQFEVSETSPWLEERLGGTPRFEFSASSWVPGSLRVASRLENTTAFESSGIPRASFSFLTSPFLRYRRFSAALLAGVSIEVLNRSGQYGGSGLGDNRTLQENMYLFPVRLGAEGRLELTGLWSAYGSLALLPVAGFTTRTPFDDGQSAYGIPLQFTLGVSNDLRWLSPSAKGVLLKVGLDATAGVATAADFSGIGLEAGVSFPL